MCKFNEIFYSYNKQALREAYSTTPMKHSVYMYSN